MLTFLYPILFERTVRLSPDQVRQRIADETDSSDPKTDKDAWLMWIRGVEGEHQFISRAEGKHVFVQSRRSIGQTKIGVRVEIEEITGGGKILARMLPTPRYRAEGIYIFVFLSFVFALATVSIVHGIYRGTNAVSELLWVLWPIGMGLFAFGIAKVNQRMAKKDVSNVQQWLLLLFDKEITDG